MRIIKINPNETERKTNHCLKCGGSGYIAKYKYTERGICFSCNGTGEPRINSMDFEELEEYQPRKIIIKNSTRLDINKARKKLRETKEEEISEKHERRIEETYALENMPDGFWENLDNMLDK